MPFPAPVKIGSSETSGGRGLFATAAIAKGDVIWRFQGDGVILTGLTGEAAQNRTWTFAELQALEQDHPERLKEILWGGYLHDPTGVLIEPVDGAQFTNHSSDPNCGGDWGATPVEDFSIAVRDIAAGDEILDDYGVYRDMEQPWLKDLLVRHCAEGAIFEAERVQSKPVGYFTPVQ
jgi:hypothetical protein